MLADPHCSHAKSKIPKRFLLGDTQRRGLHIRSDLSNSEDQLWVKDLTAIGDSCAAGIGADEFPGGSGDADCAGYHHAFQD